MSIENYRLIPGFMGLAAAGVSVFYQNLPATFISLASGLSASWLTTERRLQKTIQSNDEFQGKPNLFVQPTQNSLNDTRIEVLHNHAIREAFLEAFDHAQKKVIVVCPWIGNGGVTSELICSMTEFIERDAAREILIVYGHQLDIRGTVDQQEVDRLATMQPPWKYGKVKELALLARKFPGQLKLRIMTSHNKVGTHEKFIICDDQYVILGSYNFLTSRQFAGSEIAVKIASPDCIRDLTEHINEAAKIEAHPTVSPDDELAIQQELDLWDRSNVA